MFFFYSWKGCISCFSYFLFRQCNQSKTKCESPKLFSLKLRPKVVFRKLSYHERISPCEQEEPYTIQKNKTGSWGQFKKAIYRRCRHLHCCNLRFRQFTWVICCAQEERIYSSRHVFQSFSLMLIIFDNLEYILNLCACASQFSL